MWLRRKDKQVINGIESELQAIPTLYLGGQTFTPASLAGFIQNRINVANGVDTAGATWEAALSTYDAAGKKTDLVLTAEQRAVAAKKAKATRKARGTMPISDAAHFGARCVGGGMRWRARFIP